MIWTEKTTTAENWNPIWSTKISVPVPDTKHPVPLKWRPNTGYRHDFLDYPDIQYDYLIFFNKKERKLISIKLLVDIQLKLTQPLLWRQQLQILVDQQTQLHLTPKRYQPQIVFW